MKCGASVYQRHERIRRLLEEIIKPVHPRGAYEHKSTRNYPFSSCAIQAVTRDTYNLRQTTADAALTCRC